MSGLETPVAFMIFRRPDLTRQVWRSIAAARPRRLFVVADGPRADHPGEAELCEAARGITEEIDWPCDVTRNYSTDNMGCAERMGSGITWVFDHVEEAIILEDDCVPDPAFYRFGEELLRRFAKDDRVWVVSGSNVVGVNRSIKESYFFSSSLHLWGWATWRRAWSRFDLSMSRWPQVRDTGFLRSVVPDPEFEAHWRETFDLAHARRVDTWDFAWVFACWLHGALAAVPARNLVSNVGFGDDSTHTKDPASRLALLAATSLDFPLNHPKQIARAVEWDLADFRTSCLAKPPLRRRVAARLRRVVSSAARRMTRRG